MYFTLISFIFTILVSVLYNKSIVDTNVKTVFNKQTIVNVMMSFGSEEESLICDLKQHKYTFKLFIDCFGESIAEFANFNKREKRNNLFQHACTTSDEAFGIFTIERCWDTWFIEVSQHKKTPPRASAFTKKNSNKKYCGWTKEGLLRYSDIAKSVFKSRQSDTRKNEEEEYRLTYQDQYMITATNSGTNTNILFDNDQTNTNTFVPYNDLPQFDINDNASNNSMHVRNKDSGSDNSDNGKYTRCSYYFIYFIKRSITIQYLLL